MVDKIDLPVKCCSALMLAVIVPDHVCCLEAFGNVLLGTD